MENDPRDKNVSLLLLGANGEVRINQGELHSVSEYHYPPRVELRTKTCGTFNLNETKGGLYPMLLRIIAECHEYGAAADEVAAQTEARIQ